MRGVRFSWYELRTPDPDAAQAFYSGVLGWCSQKREGGFLFHRDGVPLAELSTLPERARALGAPAHWLGHIAVPEVEAWAGRLIAAGAERLGPVRRDAGGEVASLRSPLGEVIGLSSRGDGPSRAVAWHELHSADAERAWSIYSGLLDWRATETLELGAAVGSYRTFLWEGSPGSVGGMADTARAPQIHPHWLFYLAVDDLERAMAEARARGGRILHGPTVFPGGDRIAAGEDAQGAAFGLREPGRPTD
jgi:predicted enzyme related to lactoylglutathione lyase